ncbi:MAG: hypothetical protein HYR91_08660 [Flavobacteriia bacterium]|nr:hypothetical protein [Flavobacteriia bacterium]
MKRLIFSIFFVGFSLLSFGQQGPKEAVSQSKVELVQAKNDGVFNFVLPEGTTPDKVAENSKYYTLYFKVNYNADTRQASVVMVTNDEKSRHVICRFLVASGVDKVNTEGKLVNVEEFFQTYLK